MQSRDVVRHKETLQGRGLSANDLLLPQKSDPCQAHFAAGLSYLGACMRPFSTLYCGREELKVETFSA